MSTVCPGAWHHIVRPLDTTSSGPHINRLCTWGDGGTAGTSDLKLSPASHHPLRIRVYTYGKGTPSSLAPRNLEAHS